MRNMSTMKRKRLMEAVENSPPLDSPAAKKKRGGRKSAVEKDRIMAENNKARSVFEVLRQHRGDENRDITQHFLRNPPRRADPEYYKQIKSPIDLARIQQKLNTEEYSTFEEFCEDVELLVSNTKAYYKEDSEEYQDACALSSIFKDAKERASNGLPLIESESEESDDDTAASSEVVAARSVSPCASRSSTPEQVELIMIDDVLCGILELTEGTRLVAPPFRVLQSKEEFPLYYEKVANPIDLKRIAEKGRAGEYKNMVDFEADIRLLCRNAQIFSGKGSEIYKDAVAIVDYFKQKSNQVLEKGGVHPKRREKVVRVVDSLLAQSVAAVVSEWSEDSEEDEDSEESTDPMWKLYWTLRNEPDPKEKGTFLSDPFLELPNRHAYPDYYEDIKIPMSFFMINKKMKRKEYSKLEDMFRDCIQVFENACEYNIEESDYYISAKKLKDIALKTVRQLSPSFDLADFEIKPKIRVQFKKAVKLEDFDDTSSEDKGTPPPQRKPKSPKKKYNISTGMSEIPSTPGKPGRKSMDELQLRYRQKCMTFWELVYNYKENDYWPAGAFMDVPNRKDYPEYFKLITFPIDLRSIRDKIETNKYASSDELMADFRLMFDNCRRFNEPRSNLVQDANLLENMVLRDHEGRKDAPYESPMLLKQKLGWLRTKLPEKPKRARPSLGPNGNGAVAYPYPTPTQSFGVPNGYYGLSDDDSNSNSSYSRSPVVYAPKPVPTPKVTKMDRKMEDMISKLPVEQQRMWQLFNHINSYRNEEGRRLSEIFFKLPTKEEFPQYYEVIKKPMDLYRIQQRLNGQNYGSWNDLVADLTLMLDNACKFNEPGSDIYKDTLSLQMILLDKKRELGSTDDNKPRVQVEVRAMLTNIFSTVFNKKDDDGISRSDSFLELPDILKSQGVPSEQWPFSFDQIKKNIDKCRYRRLDRFQRDFFNLFEQARIHAKPGSRLFEDAACLQIVFIRERDNLKNTLFSTAYLILEKDVQDAINKQRLKRIQAGEIMDPSRRESTDEIAAQDGEVDLDSIVVDGFTYSVPCYVYVARTDDNPKGPCHLMRVERIYRSDDGENTLRGTWVYRPSETIHLPNRRFVENEVFLTPFQDVVLATRILGRCQVVPLKVYLNNTVDDVEAKDLFVCEFRYLGKPRYFVKCKNWPHPEEEDNLKTTPRDRPISPVRIASDFINKDEDVDEKSSLASSSSSDDDDRMKDSIILDVERPEVRSRQEPDEDGRTFYHCLRFQDQKNYSLGDFVLVFNANKPYCDVMRIDRLWKEKDGSGMFSGGWFARPLDIQHDTGRMFTQKEVFAVIQSDQTRKVEEIQNHCAVLLAKDYVKQRPTEIAEYDVFYCEHRIKGQPMQSGESCCLFQISSSIKSEVEESEEAGEPMHISTVDKMRTLKQYNRSQIVDDEIFMFKAPITVEKEMSPLLKNDMAVPLDPIDMDMMDTENDTDGTESVTSNPPKTEHDLPTTPANTATWLASQPKLTPKSKSGYILFSAEVRKRIMHENPEAGFGEVSKIVGIEWKKLSDEQKRQYEVRAEYIATERAKQEAVRAELKERLQPGQVRIWQCRWSHCDSQFDQENGLFEHIVQHHTSQIIMDSENQYVCMWVTCLRNRKDGKPFPSLPRLHRHMKEKHLNSAMRNVYQNQITRNFFKLVTTPTSGGDNYQLVHCPFGGRAPAGGQPSTPQANQPHVNGHSQLHMNGEHQYAPQNSHPVQNQPTNQVQSYHVQPSSSQNHQQSESHPGHAAQIRRQPGGYYVQNPQQVPAQQAPVPIGDPGRAVVKLQMEAEPVFVHAPSSFMSRRVLHSDTYLRYIESLGSNRQKTVSHWDRTIGANGRNTQLPAKRQLPSHWLRQVRGRDVVPEEDVVSALWKLRDQILESTTGISHEREYTGTL